MGDMDDNRHHLHGSAGEGQDPLARLLHGAEEPTTDAERRLAALLRTLRTEAAETPAPDVAERHLALIAEEAEKASHLHPTPVAAGSGASVGHRLAVRARRVLGLTAVKVALAATAAAAATGGLAATDSLPDPVQAVVAEVGERVGIRFPSPQDGEGPGRVDEDVREGVEEGPKGEGVGEDPGQGREFGRDVSETARENAPETPPGRSGEAPTGPPGDVPGPAPSGEEHGRPPGDVPAQPGGPPDGAPEGDGGAPDGAQQRPAPPPESGQGGDGEGPGSSGEDPGTQPGAGPAEPDARPDSAERGGPSTPRGPSTP